MSGKRRKRSRGLERAAAGGAPRRGGNRGAQFTSVTCVSAQGARALSGQSPADPDESEVAHFWLETRFFQKFSGCSPKPWRSFPHTARSGFYFIYFIFFLEYTRYFFLRKINHGTNLTSFLSSFSIFRVRGTYLFNYACLLNRDHRTSSRNAEHDEPVGPI